MADANERNKANELNTPEWLNEDFFIKLLKEKNENNNVKITKITFTPGTTKSDNYGSVMFRAKLNYVVDNGEEKAISLIIKTMPVVEGGLKEFLDEFPYFDTEIKMYSETLPQIEQILRSHGDDTQLCAKLLYLCQEPAKCLVFEDLCELGYKMISKRHASMEEVKEALKKLAKLHAVSYKLAMEGDTSITAHKDGSCSDRKIMDLPMVGSALKTVKAVLAEESDLAYFVPLLTKIEDEIFERIFATFNCYQNGERDGIFALNHGDFHVKNMMIRERDGKLSDLMLVDYQISVFGPAVIDVMYAIIMLFSPEMRRNHRDELIYHYFTNFQNTLKSIDYKGDIPKMIEFQHEMLKHSHWELYLFLSFIIFSYTLIDPEVDAGKAVEDENFRRSIFKRPEVLEEFRVMLPKYLHRGYFDL